MTWTNSLAALAAREFSTHPEGDIEQTDWIHQGFDAAQARFLMVTAITHHRFSSPIWGRHEVRKLHGELAEIEASAFG
jgi:isocitrate dehydrogenase kinase/phosphatase